MGIIDAIVAWVNGIMYPQKTHFLELAPTSSTVPVSTDYAWADNVTTVGKDHFQLVERANKLFPSSAEYPDQSFNRRAWIEQVRFLRGTTRGWVMDQSVEKKPKISGYDSRDFKPKVLTQERVRGPLRAVSQHVN